MIDLKRHNKIATLRRLVALTMLCALLFTNTSVYADTTKAEEPADFIEPIEPITPIQAEEREAEIVKAAEKAPENYQTDYEYETEYVETYEEDGAEDSYYENPEPIPEPVPEYKEHERKVKAKAKEQAPIEPIHTGDIDEDYYYEPIPEKAPSNELEAKYERYLEDLRKTIFS